VLIERIYDIIGPGDEDLKTGSVPHVHVFACRAPEKRCGYAGPTPFRSTARVRVNIPLVMLNPRYVNGTFIVTIRTTAAQTFYLESTDLLSPSSWVTRASIAGDGILRDLTDTGASGPQRFYRIRTR